MVYRRRRRARRKPRRNNIKTMVKAQVSRALKTNIETKHSTGYIDQSVGTNTFFVELVDLLMSTPGQGVQSSGWVGNEIRLQGLATRWELALGDTTNSYRMILFVPQPNYAPNVGSTFLFNTPNKPFLSTLNREYVRQVLLDRVIFQGGVNSGGTQITRGRKYIKLRNRLCKFQSPGGIQAEANVHIYACMVTDSSIAPHPRMTMLLDLGYTDA